MIGIGGSVVVVVVVIGEGLAGGPMMKVTTGLVIGVNQRPRIRSIAFNCSIRRG